MYALNLAEDGRILSATFPQYAPKDAVTVDVLPEGNVADYRYVDGEFVHDPLPVPEEPEVGPTTEERITALEEENAMLKEEAAMLTECVLELSSIVYA